MGDKGRSIILSLYREILRTHRTDLPPPMRALGDRYARDEFRRHKEGNTTEVQWREFHSEWQKYLLQIKGVNHEPVTGELTDDVFEKMTDEQKQQLARLHEQAVKVAETLAESLKDPAKK
eukprot:8900050-Pyramimonas_sp.AAC.1